VTFQASAYEAIVPGVYDASVLGIETGENEYGPFRRWRFRVITPDGETELTAMTSGASGPRSKAYGWAATLLGRRPSDGEEQLSGRRCQLVLTVNDDGFNRVAEILPPKPGTPPPADKSTVNLKPNASTLGFDADESASDAIRF
jgi:hypothetical protein